MLGVARAKAPRNDKQEREVTGRGEGGNKHRICMAGLEDRGKF